MNLQEIVTKRTGKAISQCSNKELYFSLLEMTKGMAEEKVSNEGKRKLYYISAEFLIGKLLSNNLINLGIYEDVKKLLADNGKSLAEIEEVEPEPSLGNGGLGRLAACFLDSIATLGLNGDGVGLNYHYGLFKQVFENNLQHETPNPWIEKESWLTKTDRAYTIQFGGFNLQSRMYDIDVLGYNNRTTKLHLFDVETVDESLVGDGIDFDKERHLLDLIRAVHQIEGIERIRLGSLEPGIITEEFAEAISKLPKMCPHFHLSLQSGCNATLKRMNRRYTSEEYAERCGILRKYFENPALTTDVIVGFPGETEEEFAQTKEYLKRIHFYEMHIFKYSRRQGTRAAVMEHQVPEEIKTKRSAQLLALAESMSREFRAYYVGKEEEVLFEEPMEVDGETWYTGYTKEYVKIAAKTAEPLDNVMKRGRVEAALTDEIYRMKL